MRSWIDTITEIYSRPTVRATLLTLYYAGVLLALLCVYGHPNSVPGVITYQGF